MIGIPCMRVFPPFVLFVSFFLSFFVFWSGSSQLAQLQLLGNSGLWNYFLVSSYDRNSLHKFNFFRSGSSQLAQMQWLGELRFMKLIFFFSFRVLMIRSSLHEFLILFFRSGRLHVAQTQWVGELRFMKLFLVSSDDRSFLHDVFLSFFFSFFFSGWVVMIAVPCSSFCISFQNW